MALFAVAYNAGGVDVDAETRALYPSVSRTALHEWRLRRAEAKRRGGGAWSALRPHKSGNPYTRSAIDRNPDLAETIQGLMVKKLGCSAPYVLDELGKRFDAERISSLRAIQRFMKAEREDPRNARMFELLEDPDGYRRRYTPAVGRADASIVRLNQRWEADSTSADVQCTDGPMQLIAILDVYSRRVKVLVTPRSRTTAVVHLLRRCILELGVPESVRTDNGGEYKSKHIDPRPG